LYHVAYKVAPNKESKREPNKPIKAPKRTQKTRSIPKNTKN